MNRVQELADFEAQFREILNKSIDKTEFATVTTPGADVEFSIEHSRGFIPIGFLVIDIDKAAVVYRSATAWTDSLIYLKCNVATCAARILVF